MRGNNILGAVIISCLPLAYFMSAVSMGVLNDYDTFCQKYAQCPDTTDLDFDPRVVFEHAKFTIYLGVSGTLGIIWTVFYCIDRFSNKTPIYNSDGVLISGDED